MELFDLTGKTALITGASSGLGERFARVLVGAGAKVILAARRVDRLQKLADELNNHKTKTALVLPMDVSSKDSIKECFKKLEHLGEKIDICINDAGIARDTSIWNNEQDDEFENVIQTNVIGLWYVTKLSANHMKLKKIEGSIINIGSVCGASVPFAGGSAYCASKAAVIQITRTLVGELSPYKIRINCINPGLFKTEMTAGMCETRGDSLQKEIPCNFIAETKEMDGTLLYLASNNASRYTTGSCITVDGGISWGGDALG